MPERGRAAARSLGLPVLLLGVVACQSTSRVGDRYYEAGRLPEAAAAYQVLLDSESADQEQTVQTLYRLGVIYGTPGSSVYDPARSVKVLEELLGGYPGSPFAPEARLLRDLQVRIRDLGLQVAAEQVRLAELEVDLAERERELVHLEEQVGDRDDQIQALQESIPPLRIEIRNLIHDLAAKQEELEQLERLKAIDLDQPPP